MLLELRPAALTEKPLGELLRHLTDAVTGRSRVPVALTVEGDLAAPAEEYRSRLGIEEGELFVRSRVMAAMTAIEELHRRRTGAAPTVAPVSEVDREQHTVNIRFVVGGP